MYNQYDLMLLRLELGIDKLKPGLTGWAQINGRDKIPIKEKIKLEKEYMNRKSILFDTKIFFNFNLCFF